MTVVVFACTILSSKPAYTVSISPSRVEITIPAGGAYNGVYNVINTKEEPVELEITLEDISAEASGSGRGKTDLDWLEMSSNKLDIAPGQTELLKYHISVPNGAKGEYIARVSFAETLPPGKSLMNISSVISFPIYVAVKGTEVIKGDIEAFRILSADILEVESIIRNKGNIHIRPKGFIMISKWDKGEGAAKEIRIPLNEYDFPVYPFSSRELKAKSDRKLEPGDYEAAINMQFGEQVVQKVFTFNVDKDGKASAARLKK